MMTSWSSANKEMDNVVLSIDGRKEVNDYMRPFRGGQGSYDVIVPKFQKFADSRNQERYYVRGTYTHHNLDFSKDVLHLADLGFKQISVEPVVAQETDDYAIREEDLPQLFAEYDALAKEMVKRKKEGKAFNFFHFMIDLRAVLVLPRDFPDVVPEPSTWRNTLGRLISMSSVCWK